LTVSGDLSNIETVTISIEIRAFSVCSSTQSSYHHILFAKKKAGGLPEKPKLVAHYITIVNVRIKTYNTRINLQTFKASIP